MQNYTVHNYAHRDSVPTSTPDLLQQGRNLIAAASNSTAWISVKLPSTQLPSSSNCYVYATPCPRIICTTTATNELKEWGAPVDDSEIFRLEDLDDFIHTVLRPVPKPASLPRTRPREPDTEPSLERPKKRRKLDYGPLYDLLPQPHMHPSTSIQSRRSTKIHPYRKTHPLPIPPCKLPLPPPSEYDRSAWIIPVRGILPWDHCSSASLLDPSHHIPHLDLAENEIYWTHRSVLAFWLFLLKLKDAGSVGSLGVSFHASQWYRTISDTPSMDETFDWSQNQTTVRSQRSERTMFVPRVSLLTVDYIKIYQETRNAMYVRTALDAWAYIVSDDDAALPGRERPAKVRVLKGARLALVDARSKGMLVS